MFDRERQEANGAISVLGFDLVGPDEPKTRVRSMRGYATALIDTVITANRALVEQSIRGRRHSSVIKIATGSVGTTDFNISSEMVAWLFKQGQDAGRRFFETQTVSSPTRVVEKNTMAKRSDVYNNWKNGLLQDKEAFMQLLPYYTYFGGVAQDAGTYQQILVRYYVDLMEAALQPQDLSLLATIAAQYVASCELGSFTVLAGVKMGNPVLTAATASRLSKRCVLAKEIFTPRSGYPFDGCIDADDRTVLFDDISSDGAFLRNCVRYLRIQGAHVSDVVTLVDRKEGDSRAILEEEHCQLHAMITIDDADIEALCASVSPRP